MPNQRRFVIALWTILSIGALALFARSQPSEPRAADQPDAQLASVQEEAAQR